MDLLLEETNPPVLSLVAEANGKNVGHVAFSPVAVDVDPDYQGYILAPLAVTPDHQKHGIGSKLIRGGIRRLSETDAAILFVYGDPDYCGRFGFRADLAEAFHPPYELQYPSGRQVVKLCEQKREIPPANIRCVAALCDPALW